MFRITRKPDEKELKVGINEDARRLQQETAAEKARAEARERQERIQHAAMQEAMQEEVHALGRKFVQWANSNGIAPLQDTYTAYVKKPFRKGKEVRRKGEPYGWALDGVGGSSCDSRSCGTSHTHSSRLVVRMDGTIGWTAHDYTYGLSLPEVTPAYVRERIVRYVARSNAFIPFPE